MDSLKIWRSVNQDLGLKQIFFWNNLIWAREGGSKSRLQQVHDTLRLVLPTECDWREHIRKFEMDGACGRYEGDWKCCQDFGGET